MRERLRDHALPENGILKRRSETPPQENPPHGYRKTKILREAPSRPKRQGYFCECKMRERLRDHAPPENGILKRRSETPPQENPPHGYRKTKILCEVSRCPKRQGFFSG